MKSLQVLEVIGNYRGFSQLQALQSAAGFYIGTIFTDPETGFSEPGSRDSCYFASKEQADLALKTLEQYCTHEVSSYAGINAWEAWLISEGLDPNCVGYRWEP